jgi:hypothetical protein
MDLSETDDFDVEELLFENSFWSICFAAVIVQQVHLLWKL